MSYAVLGISWFSLCLGGKEMAHSKGLKIKTTHMNVGRASHVGVLKLPGSSLEQQGEGRGLPESRETWPWERGATDGSYGLGGSQPLHDPRKVGREQGEKIQPLFIPTLHSHAGPSHWPNPTRSQRARKLR